MFLLYYWDMRLLFTMDKKDYDKCTKEFIRNSARGIIIENNKVAMIHSLKYDYYKFPGGGIEKGESIIDALIRETEEEAGLEVIKDTIREYGYVHRIQKSNHDDDEVYIQDNYYYLCSVENKRVKQKLDDYEAGEGHSLEFVDPLKAIERNRCVKNSPYDNMMFEREIKVLELLIKEKLIV